MSTSPDDRARLEEDCVDRIQRLFTERNQKELEMTGQKCVNNNPSGYLAFTRFLFALLHQLSCVDENVQENKMTANNLAVCLGPSLLLQAPDEPPKKSKSKWNLLKANITNNRVASTKTIASWSSMPNIGGNVQQRRMSSPTTSPWTVAKNNQNYVQTLITFIIVNVDRIFGHGTVDSFRQQFHKNVQKEAFHEAETSIKIFKNFLVRQRSSSAPGSEPPKSQMHDVELSSPCHVTTSTPIKQQLPAPSSPDSCASTELRLDLSDLSTLSCSDVCDNSTMNSFSFNKTGLYRSRNHEFVVQSQRYAQAVQSRSQLVRLESKHPHALMLELNEGMRSTSGSVFDRDHHQFCDRPPRESQLI